MWVREAGIRFVGIVEDITGGEHNWGDRERGAYIIECGSRERADETARRVPLVIRPRNARVHGEQKKRAPKRDYNELGGSIQ